MMWRGPPDLPAITAGRGSRPTALLSHPDVARQRNRSRRAALKPRV